MKRLTLALSAIGFSSTIFASLPAATDPTLIDIPQLPGGLVIGVSGEYLQPSASNGDLDYAHIRQTVVSPNTTNTLKRIDPGYSWGWNANLGYVFPQTGNDINLTYFHFDSDDSDAMATPFGAAAFQVNPDVGIANASGSATAKFDLNQIEFDVGQFINVGCRLSLHPYTGLRGLDLERKIEINFTTPTEGVIDTFNTVEKSDYAGIGPIFGVDATYYITHGIGLVAHFDSGALVGNIDSKINSTFIDPTFTERNFFKADSTTRVVPVLEGKLGADYTYMFNNAAQSYLTFEVGYQTSHYYRAIDRVYGESVGSDAIIRERKTADFSLNGPYASLTLHV